MVSITPTRSHSTPQWHHVRLDARQLARREHEHMKMLFSWFHVAAGEPRDMSLWCVPDDHGGADIYLSPKSAQLAGNLVRSYQACPCAPPLDASVWITGTAGAHARRYYLPMTDTPPAIASQRLLPTPYSCRSVRSIEQTHISASWLFYSNQMAPFVQHFALAWALLSAPATETSASGTVHRPETGYPSAPSRQARGP